jgi:hypothetical protein
MRAISPLAFPAALAMAMAVSASDAAEQCEPKTPRSPQTSSLLQSQKVVEAKAITNDDADASTLLQSRKGVEAKAITSDGAEDNEAMQSPLDWFRVREWGCYRDRPVDFPTPDFVKEQHGDVQGLSHFHVESYDGMIFGKNIDQRSCAFICGFTVQGLKNIPSCKQIKYNAAKQWCWLMSHPLLQDCTAAEEQEDRDHGWEYLQVLRRDSDSSPSHGMPSHSHSHPGERL